MQRFPSLFYGKKYQLLSKSAKVFSYMIFYRSNVFEIKSNFELRQAILATIFHESTVLFCLLAGIPSFSFALPEKRLNRDTTTFVNFPYHG